VAKGTINTWSCSAPLNGTNESVYLLDQQNHQITERDGQGKWVHTNVYAGNELIATYDPLGLHFHLSDWLGTQRVQTDYAGNIEQTWQSLPFGEFAPMPNPSLGSTEQHFTGKERDTETGNDYFMARYYSSSMGRFMSPDWSAKEEPVPYAKLDNPQSLNLYGYVGNNPLSRDDPDGHAFGLDDLVGTVGGALVGVGVEVVKDVATGPKITAGGVIAAGVGGAVLGEGVVNAPETGGLSVVAAGAAKGAIESAGLNGIQQGVDMATGEQKDFNGKSMAVSVAAGAASGGIIAKMPQVKVSGVTSGSGNMKSVAQSVRTKIANGTAASMSLKTAVKGVIGRQVANAGKTLATAAADGTSKKACGTQCR